MDTVKEYLESKGVRPDTKLLNGNALNNWLHKQIEDEWSCIEDLEMTEGVENKFLRGKVAAYEEVLKLINK